jgi:hypothetical protein
MRVIITFPDGHSYNESLVHVWRACGRRVPKLGPWALDGVVKSVGGKNVEPDGFDEKGWPSWTLALGLL